MKNFKKSRGNYSYYPIFISIIIMICINTVFFFEYMRSQSSMQLDELKTEADEKMNRSISVDDSLNKLVDDEDVEVWLLQKPKSVCHISLKALSNGFDPKRTTSFTTV
ncbi:hypothetical protein D917_08635 [Trichinella nativa]|uniref:Uncharacterized protein n=1 Tax=Trichinella nativa TaxID=6335 RepID=A0A1Y3EIY4_9BILA|nr:hypothetical protein D917_08635 [Trichinella nativa]